MTSQTPVLLLISIDMLYRKKKTLKSNVNRVKLTTWKILFACI